MDCRARFQTSEPFKLAINKASIGWAARPTGTRARYSGHEAPLAIEECPSPDGRGPCALVMEVAHYSSDIVGWLQGLHFALSEEPRLSTILDSRHGESQG